MDDTALTALLDACRQLIATRFRDDDHHGAATMLLDDRTILTGTASTAMNPSAEVCPCGACRERLAVHGPDVLVAVADQQDPTVPIWKPLRKLLPDYWMIAFANEISPGWLDQPDSE